MNRQRRDGRSRRGAALIEFVMIIPMLAMIIGLTFFFGWTMANRLHVRESSRYAAWRHVRTKSAVGSGRLNEAFYDHRGTNIGITRGLGTEETIDDLITAAGTMGSEHATFADSVIWGCGHQGRTVRVRAKFPSEVGLYRRFQGRLASYHARDGRQWRREDDLTPEGRAGRVPERSRPGPVRPGERRVADGQGHAHHLPEQVGRLAALTAGRVRP